MVVDFGCIPVTSQGFIPESEKWERDELLKRKQNTSLLHANVHLNLANFFYTTRNRLSIIGQLTLSCNFSWQNLFLLAMATKNNGHSLKGCARRTNHLNVPTFAFSLPLHYLPDPCG